MANKPGKVVTYSKELPSIKSRPFYRVVHLVILMSPIQFAGLERKRLSLYQLLVALTISLIYTDDNCNF